MFTIYTRFTEQKFKSKEQATDFYDRCTSYADGAESDYYYDILEQLETCANESELVMPDYIKTKVCLYYNDVEDYLIEKKEVNTK